MLLKTKGIVLNFIKFKETSIISKIYTERFGVQSYIINGIRVKKPKFKISFFQPLSLLDLVVYNNRKSSINRLSEVKFDYIYLTNYQHPEKISICFFLSEVLMKLINFQIHDSKSFFFLRKSLLEFDKLEENFENFENVKTENVSTWNEPPNSRSCISNIVVGSFTYPSWIAYIITCT